jgi:uncharacterized small protein (DUF1192 family)
MSSKNETRKPETKLPNEKVEELQVTELEERIAPVTVFQKGGK